MPIYLTCLILVLIISTGASIPDATIRADAAEISRLNEVFALIAPSALLKIQLLMCEIFTKCCPSIKSNFNNLINHYKKNLLGIKVICVTIGASSTQESFPDKCPTMLKLVSAFEDKDFMKGRDILHSIDNQFEESEIKTYAPCSPEEAYDMFCSSAKKKSEPCERKILTHISEHNSDDEYKKYVRQVKTRLQAKINAIKSAFPKKTNKKQKNAKKPQV